MCLPTFSVPKPQMKNGAGIRLFSPASAPPTDTGIQTLLRAATHDDILVLLHSSEEDQDLQNRLYGNMTENSLKMYLEDLLFQFREGVPDYRFDEAMTRLIKTAEALAKDGKLRFS